MDPTVAAIILVAGLLLLLASGLWVGFALLATGVGAFVLFTDAAAGPLMATAFWGAGSAWELAALPLFILMGEILYRTRLASELFEGLAPLLGWLPGRLLHANVVGCGIFAASSGSSAATAATIGRMSVPELSRRGYDRRMIIGSLAGSGTLGLLLPPSIILIVYGVATEQSIARLFLAGILPGILLMALFSAYVVVWARANPGRMPDREETVDGQAGKAIGRLLPILLLIAGVIGSIYLGLASPTDAAAIGVALALLLARFYGGLSRAAFLDSLRSAVRTSSMIGLILVAAAFMTTAMAYTGLPASLARWIGGFGLAPVALIAILTVFFVVAGLFLDGISIVVLTASIILPLVQAAGIDLIWFGIYIVLVVEMSQITPPVGFNLFVIQGLTGDSLIAIAQAALPFFLLIGVEIAALVLFPGLATFLPRVATGA